MSMIEHTPVKALYGGRYSKLVGYQCQHCLVILTPSLNPSQPVVEISGGKGIPKWIDSKIHKVRVKAANG